MELCEIDWLPEPGVAMNRFKAAAVADLLLCPDADLRQYLCNTKWTGGATLGQRHDGANWYSYILQSGDSMAIKVSNARNSVSPDALARFQRAPTLPLSELALRALREPELRYQELSFLAWRDGAGPWQGLKFSIEGRTSLDMGRAQLDVVCTGPKAYYLYAQTYHEVTLDPTALKALFSLTPLDQATAAKISPDAKVANVRDELAKIGYPVAG